jgi:hypothetical protein
MGCRQSSKGSSKIADPGRLMFPTAGPLGFPIGTASRMLVVKVDLRLKRSMPAVAHRVICCGCTKAVGIGAKRTSPAVHEYAP